MYFLNGDPAAGRVARSQHQVKPGQGNLNVVSDSKTVLDFSNPKRSQTATDGWWDGTTRNFFRLEFKRSFPSFFASKKMSRPPIPGKMHREFSVFTVFFLWLFAATRSTLFPKH